MRLCPLSRPESWTHAPNQLRARALQPLRAQLRVQMRASPRLASTARPLNRSRTHAPDPLQALALHPPQVRTRLGEMTRMFELAHATAGLRLVASARSMTWVRPRMLA
jgi:hypothetical protein